MQKPEMTTLIICFRVRKIKNNDALKNMDVEVQLDPVAGQLLVPTDLYHQARISWLRTPEFSGDGFEAIDIASRISRSVEGVKLRQVQEVELANQ